MKICSVCWRNLLRLSANFWNLSSSIVSWQKSHWSLPKDIEDPNWAFSIRLENGLIVVQSPPSNHSLNTNTFAGTKKKPSAGTVVAGQEKVSTFTTDSKPKKAQTTILTKTVKKTKGQTQGRPFKKQPSEHYIPSGVTDQESNTIREITIDTVPYDFKNTDINSPYLNGLLAYLLRGRNLQRSSSVKFEPACEPQDTYVNYVYEYDIQNQVLNASLRDPNSAVIQRLQSNIADWAAEEIYKRHLASYTIDDVRLIKIVDVSKQYDNRAILRFYVSINVNKKYIPVIRRVLELVFDKLQTECFATSNKKIDWGNMVLIPVTK